MKYKFKAAILEKLNSPLKIDYISFDGKLLKGQVLVKILYSEFVVHNLEKFRVLKVKIIIYLILWVTRELEKF